MPGRGFWLHGGYHGLGFLHKQYTGSYRPAIVCQPKPVDCPERKEQVAFSECVRCVKFQIWSPLDGDLKRCWHEFKDLEDRGKYDGTWDEHPENFDPETFVRIQEEKRLNERINREMEAERPELARRAEELEKKFPPSYFSKYYGLDSDEEEDEKDDDLEEDDEGEEF